MLTKFERRQLFALVLAIAIGFAAPSRGFAKDGKKHFKEGMKFAQNKVWDKAAEKFALAIGEDPSNTEYQLFFQRALVNAAIMLSERGDMLAEQKDYNAAYQAYRQAYAFDPGNELALIKMRRMLEAQGLPTDSLPSSGDPFGPSYKGKGKANNLKTSLTSEEPNAGGDRETSQAVKEASPAQATPKRIPAYQVRQGRFLFKQGIGLQGAIENLAQGMNLNVVFDSQAVPLIRNLGNNFTFDVRDVTAPKALELILRTHNLMWTQVDRRTIVIASDNLQNRQRYEDFAVKTFYVKNTDATEVRTAIQGVLPSSKQIVPSKQLNALIVRDTLENLDVIESIIESVDKSKAEVLVDVNLYEVSRNDLLRIGNQLFNQSDPAARDQFGLGFLGGIGQQGNVIGKGPRTLLGPMSFALGLPTSAVSFFQDKGKAKLLASTQIHVLDGESHKINIGQRVPIQTAQLPSGFIQQPNQPNQNPNQQNPNQRINDQFFGGSFGIPQIQYENVGLNIDMTPTVFEDEVQVKMSIDSSSLDLSSGRTTPTFNQRKMSSVARIKDGQTTMVAGISQNEQSKTVRGIPLIGLVPILGRFFSTPETSDRQSDVVMTVTPHILRRADITERDHLAKAAGTGMNSGRETSIEEILYMADQLDAQQSSVASAGSQSGPGGAAPAAQQMGRLASSTDDPPANANGIVVTSSGPRGPQPELGPPGVVVNNPQSRRLRGQANSEAAATEIRGRPEVRSHVIDDDDDDDDDTGGANAPLIVAIRGVQIAAKGQQFIAAVFVSGTTQISSVNLAVHYDPNIFEFKGARDAGLMHSQEPQVSAQGGVLNINLERPAGTGGVAARGQLVYIIFEAKASGQTNLTLGEESTFRRPDGQVVPARFESTQVEVR